VPVFQPIDEELVQRISGGGCTAAEVDALFANLKENYETLIDFTSYVIERVVGP
jgi:hypothetical protein